MPPQRAPDPPDADAQDFAAVLILQRSGLFDGAWFLARNPDLAGPGADPLGHFHRYGWREGRWPNAYFDVGWYLDQNPDVRESGVNPVLHYVLQGEAHGRRPIEHFDPAWYRDAHAVPPGTLALSHFLLHRHGGQVGPVAEFDAAHYLAHSPDVARAGMDPFEHYLVQGAAEDRTPSAGFDPVFYRTRYLRLLPDAVPLLHYLRHRGQPGIHPRLPPADTDIPAEVRRFTRPGPLFEETEALPPGTVPLAKVLAFHLPQFHAVPENDAWWGTGFTEWTNVARGLPRFAGHHQPRVPRDLGHYTLDAATLRRQAALARAAGIHGFVFYFYWFDGRRLLHAPVDALLADRTIDLPFCLMWANENWSRRWDGSEHEVLLAQHYRPGDEPDLVSTFLRHFADPRYIRLSGRPVLMVYRAGLVPPGAVARWRRLFAEAGEDPVFVMAQSFDDRDPRPFGMDAAVEFPPHKHTDGMKLVNARLQMLDPAATTHVYDYDELAEATDLAPQPYPLIRTAVPGWDNDARRQGAGVCVHGATPAAFEAWMRRLVAAARAQPVGGEALVCVNAWNEWAEGAYLEPDVHFGAAFLNAAGRAVAGATAGDGRVRLLLVGHDAFPAGAQLLLLHLGRALAGRNGVEVAFLLLGDGALLPEYRAAGPVTVLFGGHDLARHAAVLASRGFGAALVNTCAAAAAVPALAGAGIVPTLLVHELPRLLRERGLEPAAREAANLARHVVFGAPFVRDAFRAVAEVPDAKAAVLTQGLYRPVDPAAGAARRTGLGLPDGAVLVLGLGYGDLRKGFDLFLHAWRAARTAAPDTWFLWVGDLDGAMAAFLAPEMEAAAATGTFRHEPFDPDGTDWLGAADVLLLPSREDPMPSVVLEAMSAGVPTVAFEGTGGAPALLVASGAGTSVPLGDTAAMAAAIPALLRGRDGAARERLAAMARERFAFPAYAAALLDLVRPGTLDVSVAVPSYNYARFLPARLRSVFAQAHPVREVLVLDDASTDDSEAVTRRTAAEAGRTVEWMPAAANGGSVFRQWRRAAAAARGEWLWIAEADDSCEPGFLHALADALRGAPDAVMAFTDSRAVDADGAPLWADHQAYYAEGGAAALARDGVFPAASFLRDCLSGRNLVLNASAVLFRRAALLAALDRCGAELDTFRMAGDWRLYAELLGAGGQVAYVARPLNVHRRHGGSVTHTMPAARHLDEIRRMHRHIRTVLGPRPGLAEAQRRALAEARRTLGAG